jgi:hypothetical protein
MSSEEKDVLTTYMAGVIGVDAGLCWVGDPCYILHREGEEDTPKSIGRNWMEFCDSLGSDYPTVKQFNYDLGHPGLGVCVSTGYGDGVYPVMVTKNSEGRVVRVTIEFISYENEDTFEEDYNEDELNGYELCPNCQLSVLPEQIKDGKCPGCPTETENGGE